MKPIFKISAIAAAIVGVGFVVQALLFPPTMADRAHSCFDSVWDGNGSRVYGCLSSTEIDRFHLSKGTVQSLLDWIVRPRLSFLKRLPEIESRVNFAQGLPTQGYFVQSCIDTAGTQRKLVLTTSPTNEGSCIATSDLILQSWAVSYRYRHSIKVNTQEDKFRAWLEGYREDRHLLKALGITGVFDPDDPSGPIVIPWETWEKGVQEKLAHELQKVNVS